VVTVLDVARAPRPIPPTIPNEGTVAVSTTPAGAAIWINGRQNGTATSTLHVKLPVGSVHIEARLPGYRPAETTIDVTGGSRTPVALALVPVLELKLLCSGNAKAIIDEGQAIDLQPGESVRELAVGKHSVRLSTGARGEASFSFDLEPGISQAMTEAPRTRDVASLLISNFANDSRLYVSGAPLTLKVDGRSLGQISPNGIDLPRLLPGSHTVELGDGRKNSIEIGPARTITVIIDSNPNTGTLTVVTNEEGVTVVVSADGKEVKRGQIKNGRFRLPNLKANTYLVQVSKDGYDADVKELPAEIKKREDTTLSFQLTPRIVTASVNIHVMPGAELFVDHNSVGTVAEGTYTVSKLSIGKHTFGAHLNRFVDKELAVELVEGNNKDVNLSLERAEATVQIRRNPSDSTVTYKRAGEDEVHSFNGARQQLPEGDYTFTAQAAGYVDRIEKRHLDAGGGEIIDLTLPKREPDPNPVRLAIAAWLKNNWAQDSVGDWYHRHAGGYVIFPKVLGDGAVEFSITWKGGGRFAGIGKSKAQWVLRYRDEGNHILCELDDEGFEMTRIFDGKKTKLTPKKLSINKMPRYTVRIEVKADRIVHKVRKGDAWVEVGSVSGSSPLLGYFGFFIPNNQELFLKNFGFEPAR
jgi:hypothetical protein